MKTDKSNAYINDLSLEENSQKGEKLNSLSSDQYCSHKNDNQANIFTITFRYQDRLQNTKVLNAYSSGCNHFYKVALTSNMKSKHMLCWLQQHDDIWEVLMANDLETELINVLTQAIEKFSSKIIHF